MIALSSGFLNVDLINNAHNDGNDACIFQIQYLAGTVSLAVDQYCVANASVSIVNRNEVTIKGVTLPNQGLDNQ